MRTCGAIDQCAGSGSYLISHDKQILLIGKVQHLLYALFTLHLTWRAQCRDIHTETLVTLEVNTEPLTNMFHVYESKNKRFSVWETTSAHWMEMKLNLCVLTNLWISLMFTSAYINPFWHDTSLLKMLKCLTRSESGCHCQETPICSLLHWWTTELQTHFIQTQTQNNKTHQTCHQLWFGQNKSLIHRVRRQFKSIQCDQVAHN